MQRLLNSPWDDLIHPVILIVEDSDEDFYAFVRATKKLDFLDRSSYRFFRVQDGDDALDYLFRQGEYDDLDSPDPVAILLDLNLPGTDGREVIQEIKQSPKLKTIPIIVLTTSSNPQDIETCYLYGANSYLLKPMGASEMQQTVQLLFKYWFNFSILPSYAQLNP